MDRNTSIRRKQLKPIIWDDLDGTNVPTDNQVPSYDDATKKFTWVDNISGASALNDLTDVDFDSGTPVDEDSFVYDSASGKWKAVAVISRVSKNENNIVINAFRIAINGSLSPSQMQDGIVDEFEDETGVDTVNSTNEYYEASGDYYTNASPGSADSYTKLLLHCNGIDASTTFTDDGNTVHTVTANGTAQIDTAQQQFGTGSGLFDGNSDYLTVPDHNDWDLGTGQFTLDCWVRFNTLPAGGNQFDLIGHEIALSNAQGEWYWGIRETGGNFFHRLSIRQSLSWNFVSSVTFSLSTGIWYHLEVSRDLSSDVRFFVDGVVKGSPVNVTDTLTLGSSAVLVIGAGGADSPARYFNGWLDEVRVSKGIARHTSGFTPPTSEYGSPVVANMTLISNATEAEAEPTDSKLIILQENVDIVTLNTDIKAWVSLDNGSNWEQVTLSNEGAFDNDKNIIIGEELLTDRNDKTMKWKITTHNTKELKIHGVGHLWR